MKEERKGELFISAGAVLWGLFPVLTALSVSTLPPLFSLFVIALFAAIFFAGFITVKGGWSELKNQSAWMDILLVTALNAVLYYVILFIALRYTSAGNASIIALTEIIFSYLFFHAFRKEHFPVLHVWGAVLMLIGAGIVLYPNMTTFNIGDFLVVAASAIAPFGNFFTRRARTKVKAETILFYRSILSAPIVLGLSFLIGEHPEAVRISAQAFFLLAVNGLFLFGLSKIFWVEAIHRISITKANALSSVAPLLTLIFAYFLIGNTATVWQLSALVPMFFGVLLLSKIQGPLEDVRILK